MCRCRCISNLPGQIVDRPSPSRAADACGDLPQSTAHAAMVAVIRAYGAIQRQQEPYFAPFKITPPQFQVLSIISRLKRAHLTQRCLARELYVSFANVTVMLDRLEKADRKSVV